jgi:hypothetical protein
LHIEAKTILTYRVRKQESQPHGLAFLQGRAQSENEFSKAQNNGQSDQKNANYDPNNYLHGLPLKSRFKKRNCSIPASRKRPVLALYCCSPQSIVGRRDCGAVALFQTPYSVEVTQ